MNILIDTSPLHNGHAGRGIGRYTFELLKALRAVPSSHQFFTSDDAPSHVDLIHYPFFDLFFPTLPQQKKAPTIVTIHDVIPLVFPVHYKAGVKGTISLYRQKLALRSVAEVITDSECSKRDIVLKLGVRSDHVHAIPLAIGDDFIRPPQAFLYDVKKKYGLPKHFLLYVGDINYNKNLPFLLSVVAKIPTLHLVMVGRAMNNTVIPEGKAIHDTISQFDLSSRVTLLDSVDGEHELEAILSLADAYIQPSLYEGFGLPVLEAMRMRTPVICSRGGSLPEVAGDAAVYFHPHDQSECERVIREVLRMSEEERSRMVRKGVAQVEKFSWATTAKQTISVYEKVFEQRRKR